LGDDLREVLELRAKASRKTLSEVVREALREPLDDADAMLILAAELLEVFDVLTLDRRGFATYRTSWARRSGSFSMDRSG
jgi:hypothetical protein